MFQNKDAELRWLIGESRVHHTVHNSQSKQYSLKYQRTQIYFIPRGTCIIIGGIARPVTYQKYRELWHDYTQKRKSSRHKLGMETIAGFLDSTDVLHGFRDPGKEMLYSCVHAGLIFVPTPEAPANHAPEDVTAALLVLAHQWSATVALAWIFSWHCSRTQHLVSDLVGWQQKNAEASLFGQARVVNRHLTFQTRTLWP